MFQPKGLAHRLGEAYDAFTGATANQGNQKAMGPAHASLGTAANAITEGLLGMAFDVATAPHGYAKDVAGQ